MKLYKVEGKYEPTSVEANSAEIEFLDDFIIDSPLTYYYVDEDTLGEAILGCKEMGKEPPQELVDYLYKQLKESSEGITLTIE